MALDRARREYWLRYANQLAGLMGLGHFEWVLLDKPTKCAAEIEFKDYQHVGQVQLRSDFDSQPPEWQRDTMVHEILHAHFMDIDQTVEDMTTPRPPWAPPAEWSHFCRQLLAAHLAAEEFIVSDITRAWCKTLPLPPVDG